MSKNIGPLWYGILTKGEVLAGRSFQHQLENVWQTECGCQQLYCEEPGAQCRLHFSGMWSDQILPRRVPGVWSMGL